VNELIDQVEFRVASPKVALPGLDNARAKLVALGSALDSINRRLAGLSTNSAFSRTTKGIEDVLKSFESKMGKGVTMKKASEVLGFDPKDVRQYYIREQEKLSQELRASETKRSQLRGAANADARRTLLAGEKKTQSELLSLRRTFEGQQLNISGAGTAAKFFGGYQKMALRNAKDPIDMMRAMFGGGGGIPAASGSVSINTGPIPLMVPASQIVATLGPGAITLNIPTSQVSAGGMPPGGAGGSGGGSGSASGGSTFSGATGKLLEERTTITEKNRLQQRKELLGAGRQIDIFTKEISGQMETVKEITTNSPLKIAKAKLDQQLAGVKLELQQQLNAAGGDPKTAAAIYRKQAAMMRGFVGTGDKPTAAARDLEKLGLGGVVSRTRTSAEKLLGRAGVMDRRAGDQNLAQMETDLKRGFDLRKRLEDARIRGDKAETRRLNSQRRQYEKQIAEENKLNAAGAKSQAAADAASQKVAAFDLHNEQKRTYQRATHAGANQLWQDFIGRGGQQVSEETHPLTGKRRVVGRMESGGQMHTLTVTYDQAGASVTGLAKKMKEARQESGYLAGDFIKNTLKVTTWAASVSVLYKSVELVTHSFDRMVAVGLQSQRLDQIFRQVGGSTQELTSDVLQLAAMNGRAGDEAMSSAIQWARLGLTRVQINEAVRVSLIAANVANLTAAEATEKLMGITQSYGISIGQLGTVMGEMNQIANTYNVTNADMLDGISKTASVAKQAGVPLHELMGFLGATIGATAQSGANIGNMFKSITLALSNPGMQKDLRQGFGFEVTTGGQDIKGMSQILTDVFLKYEALNDAERQHLLYQIAGRTQSSRLAAMLNNYVVAQTLAVNAQLNLNSAEVENTKIKKALASQLQGLSTEWERFVVLQGNRGPLNVLSEITKSLRNVISLMNTPLGSGIATGILALLAVAGAKVALTGMTMKEGVGSKGFLSRSGATVMNAAGELNGYVNYAASNFAGNGRVGLGAGSVAAPAWVKGLATGANNLGNQWLNVARGGTQASAAMRALAGTGALVAKSISMATIAVAEFLVPILIVYGAVKLFNYGMEQIGLSSEAAEKKLAGFNAAAEKFGAAASAALEGADLMKTVEKALPNMRSDADRQHLLSQAAEATNQDIEDPGLRAKAVDQTRAQWELLLKQSAAYEGINRFAEINKALEAERARGLQRNFNLIQDEFNARQRSIKANADEIVRLEAKQKGMFGGIGFATRQKDIDERKAQGSQLALAQTHTTLDLTNEESLEKRLEYDTESAARVKTQQTTLEAIASIYQSISASNPFEKASLELAGMNAEVQAIDRRLAAVKARDASDFAGKAARENVIGKLKEEEAAIQLRIGVAQEKSKKAKSGGLFWDYNPAYYGNIDRANKEIADANDELVKNRADQKLAGAGQIPGMASDDTERNLKERKELNQEREKKVAQRDALNINMPFYDAATQAQFGREEGKRETSPFSIGRDETQKLQNLIGREASGAGPGSGIKGQLEAMKEMPQTVELVSRQLELQNQLYEAQGALRRRSFDVERDINQLIVDRRKEFEHSILGSGPAEMLRKLASFSLGNGGKMTTGQFLSLSPEMRRDVGMVDTRFDPGMMDLRREQHRMPTTDELAAKQKRVRDTQAALRNFDAGQTGPDEPAAASIVYEPRYGNGSTTAFVSGKYGNMLDPSNGKVQSVHFTDPAKQKEFERLRKDALDANTDYQNARKGGRPSEGQFDSGQLAVSKAVADLAAQLKNVLPDTSTYDAAAQNVSRLATSAGAAADALDRIVAAANSNPRPAGPGMFGPMTQPGAAPRNAQSGGIGAGAGVVAVPVPNTHGATVMDFSK